MYPLWSRGVDTLQWGYPPCLYPSMESPPWPAYHNLSFRLHSSLAAIWGTRATHNALLWNKNTHRISHTAWSWSVDTNTRCSRIPHLTQTRKVQHAPVLIITRAQIITFSGVPYTITTDNNFSTLFRPLFLTSGIPLLNINWVFFYILTKSKWMSKIFVAHHLQIFIFLSHRFITTPWHNHACSYTNCKAAPHRFHPITPFIASHH